MTTSNDFFQNNEITGALTPQQAAQLLELASGDTSFGLDDGGAPASTTAADAAASTEAGAANTNSSAAAPAASPAPSPAPAPAAAPAAAPEAEPDASNAVLLAKDGKHTIPYEKLVQAREGEQHWKAQAETAQRQLADLQTQAQQRADAGQAPTKTDNQVAAAQAAIASGVDPALFGDFSEEALANGIATLVDQRVEERISKAIAPLQQHQQRNAQDAHFDAIYKAHPDADSVAESAELKAWIASQPSYVQPTLHDVLAKGSAQKVVELFNDFKKATAVPVAAPAPGKDAAAVTDPKVAAQAAIAAAAPAVPASLSDIPGGRADALSPHERLAAMDPVSMADAMQGMSPAQIDAFLNRSL